MTYTRIVLVSFASLLAAFIAPTGAPAATTCPPLASKGVTGSGTVSTASTGFTNVPGTFINFTQGGNKAACVLVSFSAEASAAANESMFVRADLDGGECTPATTVFVQSNATATGFGARAMNFICPGVAPGKHSIRMQYASETGGSVSLGFRNLIVHYVP